MNLYNVKNNEKILFDARLIINCYFISEKSINFAENLTKISAKQTMTDSNMRKLPHECTNITEVRNEIDNIDSVIIKLLSTRFGYVREVVKYKEQTNSGIEASDRRAAVIASRRKWAEEAGLNPDVIESLYNMLIDYFVVEEKKMMLESEK